MDKINTASNDGHQDISNGMKLSEELIWRGFVNQTTFENLEDLDKQKRTFYHGFDASADSQTVGNLAAMMMDKVFIRHGYEAILVAGGSTSLVGDPGGKDNERELQGKEAIAANVLKAEAQFKKVFAGQEFKIVNNLDWTKDISALDFLRDYGKHFSMTHLLQRDFISQRIGIGGAGISYAEFSYTLLQGLDFLFLYDTYDCTLQLGGSDQWGNCLSGVDLIRKMRGAEVHVFTLPLIMNKTTGKKFGKSEDGAVWLDENKTSVYKFYQFWLNADDAGVIDYLKIFTMLGREKIEELATQVTNNPSARQAQKTLAYEATALVHGQQRIKSVERVTDVLFNSADFTTLSDDDLNMLAAEIPTVSTGKSLIEIMCESNLATSNSDARRLLASGAVSINSQKITDDQVINSPALVKKGKNNFVLIRQD